MPRPVYRLASETTSRRLASSRWFLARRPSSAIHSRSPRASGVQRVPALGQLLLGEQARLDPLGQLDLLLGVEQRDLADLLEVVLDRVGGRAGRRRPGRRAGPRRRRRRRTPRPRAPRRLGRRRRRPPRPGRGRAGLAGRAVRGRGRRRRRRRPARRHRPRPPRRPRRRSTSSSASSSSSSASSPVDVDVVGQFDGRRLDSRPRHRGRPAGRRHVRRPTVVTARRGQARDQLTRRPGRPGRPLPRALPDRPAAFRASPLRPDRSSVPVRACGGAAPRRGARRAALPGRRQFGSAESATAVRPDSAASRSARGIACAAAPWRPGRLAASALRSLQRLPPRSPLPSLDGGQP